MTDMHIEHESAEFLAYVRSSLAVADPVPRDVSALAKIAFQFRGIPTVQAFDSSQLVGVRSSASGNTMQASKAGITLIWSAAEQEVTGVVHATEPVSLSLQTTSSHEPIVVDATNSSFDFNPPKVPHRMVVASASTQWATPWST